jgi:VWFA-related protein
MLALTFPAALPAQEESKVSIVPRKPGKERELRSNLRMDVKMILVPVSVSDQMDRPITDLSANAFRLFEDDVEQTILSFTNEEGPVSIGFIFDTSSSMKKRIDPSVAGIKRFLAGAAPGDEFFLVQFANKPKLITPFTNNPEDILTDLSTAEPEGWTALHDAIMLGVHHMKRAKNARRALVVLTDGGDNNSRYTEAEVKSLILESDVRVYSIGLFEKPHFLEKLAALTGGETFWAKNMNELPDTVDRLSQAMRHQYVIGYSPKNLQNDGKHRRVRVELVQSLSKAVNLFWRHGYMAPY